MLRVMSTAWFHKELCLEWGSLCFGYLTVRIHPEAFQSVVEYLELWKRKWKLL